MTVVITDSAAAAVDSVEDGSTIDAETAPPCGRRSASASRI
jgi:hypothetical protein